MEGIERIKNHILEEADKEVASLASETQAFVAKELNDAERQASELLGEAASRAEEDAGQLIRRGESLAEAEGRKRALVKRQRMVDQVIDRALEQLSNEPADVRVSRYLAWITLLDVESAVITLSESDLREIRDALLASLPPDRFTIDPLPGEFSGGIVVSHGRIRDNLSYDLVVRDHRADLARLALSHIEEVMPEVMCGDKEA